MIRYYWEEDIDNCVARMSSSMYIYGHEYLGAGGEIYLPITRIGRFFHTNHGKPALQNINN